MLSWHCVVQPHWNDCCCILWDPNSSRMSPWGKRPSIPLPHVEPGWTPMVLLRSAPIPPFPHPEKPLRQAVGVLNVAWSFGVWVAQGPSAAWSLLVTKCLTTFLQQLLPEHCVDHWCCPNIEPGCPSSQLWATKFFIELRRGRVGMEKKQFKQHFHSPWG